MGGKYAAGTILACYLEEYSDEEPQLGRLTKEYDPTSENFEIEWMIGTYSDSWKVWKQKHGRSYKTWKQVIPLRAVLFPVKLSNAGRLSNSMVVKLKQHYEQKRN